MPIRCISHFIRGGIFVSWVAASWSVSLEWTTLSPSLSSRNSGSVRQVRWGVHAPEPHLPAPTPVTVQNFASIFCRYFNGWFTIDIIASLPVDLAVKLARRQVLCTFAATCTEPLSTDPQLLRMAKMLRLARLVQLLRIMRIRRLLSTYEDLLSRCMPALTLWPI